MASAGPGEEGLRATDRDLLRAQLVDLLAGQGAHMPFEAAVPDFPAEALNWEAPNVPYTPWHLVEHIRRAQHNILEYVTDPDHASPPWPDGYWPARDETTTDAGFAASVAGYLSDRAALIEIIREPTVDLFVTLPGTPEHTLLREARLSADHTAYHVGELAVLRQVMGTWPSGRTG